MKELIDQIIIKTKELEALRNELYENYGIQFCDGYDVTDDKISYLTFRGINELAGALDADLVDRDRERYCEFNGVKFKQLGETVEYHYREAKIPKKEVD